MELTAKEIKKIVKLMRFAYNQRAEDIPTENVKYGNIFDKWAKEVIKERYTVYNFTYKITDLSLDNKLVSERIHMRISKQELDLYIGQLTEDHFIVTSNNSIESSKCPNYKCMMGVRTETSNLVQLYYWED